MATLLQVEQLQVVLGSTPILHGLTFEVAAGRWVGLIGPNGSGKTTLLRALSGVLPYAGSIRFEGQEVRDWKPQARARRLAFVPQGAAPVFDFQVAERVLLGRSPHKRWLEPWSADDRARVRQALAQVDLDGFEERNLLQLSGGERQRVLLAQALVQDADLLLLDEPTTHLDIHHQFAWMEQVQTLVADGKTVIGVFHDLELAARYAHHLLVLYQGRLVAAGPPADVLTPERLAAVFRMQARVQPAYGGGVRIDWQAPS
jgi:iron complex transport system ATP-binding protein